MFSRCIGVHPQSLTTDPASTLNWNVRQWPYSIPNSGLYWISPANLQTHDYLLSVLAVDGLGSVLSAIASVSDKVVSHLSVFQITFLVLSYCKDLQFHVDFDEVLVGKFWSFIVPVQLVNRSHPELLVQGIAPNLNIEVKYQVCEAILFGPIIMHSTALVNYIGTYRVCLSLNICCIDDYNVRLILPDITQPFPPSSEKQSYKIFTL